MIEIQGKYNKCKVFTDVVDSSTIGQLTALMNQESIAGSNIAIMPDCHAGTGCVIGTTMTITDKVIPNLVGVDIGCGMAVVELEEKHIEFQKLDKVIKENVPSGGNIRTKFHKYSYNADIEKFIYFKYTGALEAVAPLSIGTLGGGNHFIEIDKDEDGKLYLVIHTGSRKLGKEIAEFYQKAAYFDLQGKGKGYKEAEKEAKNKYIEQLKAEGRTKEIGKLLKSWEYKPTADEIEASVPYELAYCKGELFDEYITDMKLAQEYAYWNREAIIDEIVRGMKFHVVDKFHTIHNYIDTENMILRKGAISCQKGEKVLIPINMRDGSLVCIGKGNPDYNFSGPHGAGRLMSRREAKSTLTVSEFKKTMKEAGVYTTCVGQGTLDESPMAYKNMNDIIDNISDTADIVKIIKPVYNFKAGAED